MIEARIEDVERYKRSYRALYDQEGRNLDRFLSSVAESRAYAQALIRHQQITLRAAWRELGYLPCTLD